MNRFIKEYTSSAEKSMTLKAMACLRCIILDAYGNDETEKKLKDWMNDPSAKGNKKIYTDFLKRVDAHVEKNPEFVNHDYFQIFKNDALWSQIGNFENGKIFISSEKPTYFFDFNEFLAIAEKAFMNPSPNPSITYDIKEAYKHAATSIASAKRLDDRYL